MAIYYPDAHPESVCVDGEVVITGAANWAAAQGAAAGTAITDSVNIAYAQVFRSSGDTYSIRRPVLMFDTRTLPTNARITAAVLSVYITSSQSSDNDGEDYIVVTTVNPASNTSLSTADFNKFSTTANSDTKDISSISTSAYLDFTLNAAGIANIAKAGISKFALREGHDILNHAYAGALDSGNQIQFQTAENTNKPKLTITYTVPGGNILWF